jgi:four helix bundle protein
MARLQPELLSRTKRFAHRVVDVAEAIARSGSTARIRARIVDQIVGCGTSVGANTREAAEAMSRSDFCKSIAIVLKELGECRFWLEFVTEREWVPPARMKPLLAELDELAKIFNTILARSRNPKATKSTPSSSQTPN